jgi:hypothetical protein
MYISGELSGLCSGKKGSFITHANAVAYATNMQGSDAGSFSGFFLHNWERKVLLLLVLIIISHSRALWILIAISCPVVGLFVSEAVGDVWLAIRPPTAAALAGRRTVWQVRPSEI